jgi:periplasmic divalent cation tolerance protein
VSGAPDANGAALLWGPFPDEDSAATVAGVLLDEGLVACANLLPAMRSLFVWQGVRDEARECGALFKTRAGLLEPATARLSALHPYAAPAVVGWRCECAGAPTLAWLEALGRDRETGR